jgi:hypothetical protein
MRLSGRHALISFAMSAVALACLLAFAGTAHALTLTAPSDTRDSVDVTITLGPADTPGVVTLFEDGVAVAHRDNVSSATTATGLPLDPGPHRLTAELRTLTGAVTVSAPRQVYRWGTPGAPRWVTPSGGTVSSPCDVRVRAGASCASMTLQVNGTLIRCIAVGPGMTASFGKVRLHAGSNTLSVTATSLYGEQRVFTRTLTRASYPYATCIIVDKSQHRLYWIRNTELVKVYPIADGRGNCTPIGTWKILAKYVTDPHGVYGPRKMRLFRRVGRAGHYRYVFTAYGIHGTNQPWVIGTQASHGCIRMYNSDVLQLWPQVPLGTMVITRA